MRAGPDGASVLVGGGTVASLTVAGGTFSAGWSIGGVVAASSAAGVRSGLQAARVNTVNATNKRRRDICAFPYGDGAQPNRNSPQLRLPSRNATPIVGTRACHADFTVGA